ncbi:hypothetical protein EJB05_45246, partial [Eragrostis curvula]
MFGSFGKNTDATPPPTFKVFSKADEGRCLAVRDGALVLAAADPSDERQHWTKDVRYSRVIKDEEGNPVFSLVNAATGLAVQHSRGPGHPVTLARFYPDGYAESLFWTESADLRKAFGRIRMMHNVDLCMDAPGAAADVVLSYVDDGLISDGQSWKTVPWSGEACAGDELDSLPTCRIYCRADEGFSVTVRDGAVCLAPTDPGDEGQHWVVDRRPGELIRDMNGSHAFVLVSKVTGEAIAGGNGWTIGNVQLKLKPYNPNFLDVPVLWATSPELGHGFRCIHQVDDTSANFDAFQDGKDVHGEVCDGNRIGLSHWGGFGEGDDHNLQWKIVPWCKSHYYAAHLSSSYQNVLRWGCALVIILMQN